MTNGWRWTIVALTGLAWCAATWSVWRSPTGQEIAPRKESPSDLELYRAVARRVHAGESYYDVMGDELRQRGYPTRSAFNWRVPAPFWMFALAPGWGWPKVVLVSLATLLLVGFAAALLRDTGIAGALLGVVALVGGALPCFLGDLYVNPLLWTSTLLGLSLCAVAWQRPGWSIACGIAAAFFRELAVGYCLALAVLAIIERRWREAFGWGAGLAVFGMYLAGHVLVVSRLNQADVSSLDTSTWWQIKSPLFLVQAAQMNGFLLLLPVWCAWVYLSASLAGLAANSAPWARRALWVTLGYLAGFIFVGKELNDYWGQLLTMNLAVGLSGIPAAVRGMRRWLQGGKLSADRAVPGNG